MPGLAVGEHALDLQHRGKKTTAISLSTPCLPTLHSPPRMDPYRESGHPSQTLVCNSVLIACGLASGGGGGG